MDKPYLMFSLVSGFTKINCKWFKQINKSIMLGQFAFGKNSIIIYNKNTGIMTCQYHFKL